MWIVLLALLLAPAVHAADEVVGERPYEMVWANRTQDDHPPLVDFESLEGWSVNTNNSEATLQRTRAQQLFGQYVGRLTYRSTGSSERVLFGPAQPVRIGGPFEAVSCWIYGNNWGFSPNPKTPPVTVTAVFADAQQREFKVGLATVNWTEWYLCQQRLTPEQIAQAKGGASFLRFEVSGGRNKDDRTIYLDNLAVFVEPFAPLSFEPRPARGIPMFPGQTVGTNTGPGKLPFPTRLQTILPDNLTAEFVTSAEKQGGGYAFTYRGKDGTLVYKVTPRTGTWSDVTACWPGRGGTLRPLVDGGAYFTQGNAPLAPEKIEPLGNTLKGGELTSRWRLSSAAGSAEVTYVYRLWNKSLVIDTLAPGGAIAEVRYGHAEGAAAPRLVTNPYYQYAPARPAVLVMGPPDKPLFLTGNTDWYLSNASAPFAVNAVSAGQVSFQGGTRYTARTDGKRNDVYERFFVTLSPRYEEVLPTPANPVSPYKAVAGTRVWRAHGAGNRTADAAYWTNVRRHGMTECVITDHETGWRDGGESFTFRTKAAPKKGGDQGQFDYARLMQDKLGFVYGPYNNYTDFAPVNEFWSSDLISRTPDNQLQRAWMRCYAPKPARAVEYCAKLAPIIQQKFKFSTAYCDVHTCVSPWSRTDYDARVPGAGTFAATFYAYGEIMLHQKAAWQGPVYSEGTHHFWYSGLTDGNYAQDQAYNLPENPWLVDLDLRKMHNLCCNFGMGNPGMFYGREASPGSTQEERDAFVDRFLAATVAFGHPGFLVMEGGFPGALRSYYMVQQLAARYTQAAAASIRYVSPTGGLLDTSAAVATGAYRNSQVVTTYADGTVTLVNGSRERPLRLKYAGVSYDLPPNGYAGFTKDKSVLVYSGPRSSRDSGRIDYCRSPRYLYLDGRGRFARYDLAASDGIGICRLLGPGKWEIIPYQGADCGFKLPASTAVALDKENRELGPAQLRVARGLTYVVPVAGAFSYLLTATGQSAPARTLSARAEVIAGEQVAVSGGTRPYTFTVPADAREGQRLWQQFDGAWLDFTVVPLAQASAALAGNSLSLTLVSNLAEKREARVSLLGAEKTVALQPQRPVAVSFDLGEPQREDAAVLSLELAVGELRQRLERGLRTVSAPAKLADLPADYVTGMCLRGKPESSDLGETRAQVTPRAASVGGLSRPAIFMHPPWTGGVGYAFLRYAPVQLPVQPCAFRADVGKSDGSDAGDGILYKVVVVDAAGAETVAGERTVLKHEWTPLQADLSRWAGRKISLKLVSDVGLKDDSSGDWACWSKLRLETLQPVLTRLLEPVREQYRRDPAPFPARGLKPEDLRRAVRGRLGYDGCGLAGTGDQYGSFAQLNGVNLGNMAPAGGDEVQGLWSEKVSVPLTAAAIATLGRRNVFALLNPGGDAFKVRRFWIELELPDGRRVSTDIAATAYTQPATWLYAEGVGVGPGSNIEVELWFDL